jgi:hypothetical protein
MDPRSSSSMHLIHTHNLLCVYIYTWQVVVVVAFGECGGSRLKIYILKFNGVYNRHNIYIKLTSFFLFMYGSRSCLVDWHGTRRTLRLGSSSSSFFVAVWNSRKVTLVQLDFYLFKKTIELKNCFFRFFSIDRGGRRKLICFQTRRCSLRKRWCHVFIFWRAVGLE